MFVLLIKILKFVLLKLIKRMDQTFLYTLPQWFIFAGIFVTAYGWIENKQSFRLIGYTIIILLGFYSVYILTGDYFAASKFLTPEEIMREELEDEVMNEVPFQAKLLPAYWSFVASSLLILPSLFFDLKHKKSYRIFIFLSGITALAGFFMIVGAVRSL